MAKVGMRVVRGPNWRWEEQDQGEGNVGTVVEYDAEAETAVVKWDHGKEDTIGLRVAAEEGIASLVSRSGSKFTYRAGKNHSYDLRTFDCCGIGVFHSTVTCDECKESRMKGLRWQCVECDNYDLCTFCYMTDKHALSHSFVRYDTPDHSGIRVSPRCYSAKISVKAMKDSDWNRNNKCSKENMMYYRDHLPIFGLSPSKDGSHACPYSTGDRVIVTVEKDILEVLQDGHGGWNSDMAEYINVLGTVVYGNQRGIAEVYYDNCMFTWTINNEALVKIGPFQNGDEVTITSDMGLLEKYQTKHALWHTDMIQCLGKRGTIVSVYNNTGALMVEVGEAVWEMSPLCFTEKATVKSSALSPSASAGASSSNTIGNSAGGLREAVTSDLREHLGTLLLAALLNNNSDSDSDEKTAPRTPPRQTHQEETQALPPSNTSTNSKYTCTICCERERDAIFTCGHGSCVQCAASLRVCHMCRKRIEKVIKMYD